MPVLNRARMNSVAAQQKILVSVIIPAHNEAMHIRASIESALDQTIAPFEVIVVDDGSTDATATIAEQAGARVIRQDCGGVSAARNRGVSEAGGEWIAFLDADDRWTSDKLERQMLALADNPEANFSACDFSREQLGVVRDEMWMLTRKPYLDVVGERRNDEVAVLTSEELARSLSHENFFPTSSILVRREVFNAVGGFDESMAYCEDHDCWMRIAQFNRAAVVHKSLVLYKMHEKSASSRWERILEGDVDLARRMLDTPQSYHVEAVSLAAALLPNRLQRLGEHYARTGKPQLAVPSLFESIRKAPGVKSLIWLGISIVLQFSPLRRLFDGFKARRQARAV